MKFPFLHRQGGAVRPLELPDTPALSEFYDTGIALFSEVYAGYCPDWHKVGVVTPDGVKNRCVAGMRVAKAVCAEMANLICSEGVGLSITSNYRIAGEDGCDTVADAVESVLQNADFYGVFPGFVEHVLAEGGGAVALYTDSAARAVSLKFYRAQDFIPLCWSGARITDARFIDRLCVGGERYGLVTRHRYEKGVAVISRSLHRLTDAGLLGERISLGSVLPELEAEQIFEQVSGPLFVYFSPAGSNNLAPDLPLGISVYANALDTLRSLDIAFDSLRNEFVLGKKRIIVPAAALRKVIDPSTGSAVRYFDNSSGVYEALNIDEDESLKISDQTSVLRIDEHIAAINALLEILCMQTGLSYGSLSFAGGAPKTATEVVSQNSKSFRTKQLHQNAFTRRIRELTGAVAEVLKAYGYLPADAEFELAVSYADSVVTDENDRRRRTLELVDAGLMSRRDAVTELFGVTADAAHEMLHEIDFAADSAPQH